MSSLKERDKLLSGDDVSRRDSYHSILNTLPSFVGSESTMPMSESQYETLSAEVNRQKIENRRRSRSMSDNDLMTMGVQESTGTILDANDDIEKQGRRTLYGTLPFVAAFGMQKKETNMKKVISAVSLHSLLLMSNQESSTEQTLVTDMSKVDVDELTITFHLVMAVLMALISQFLVGYNTSVMNAPEHVVFPGHSTVEWSLAVSAFAIGGPGGAVLGGYLANTRGRKGAMLINIWVFFVGGLLMTCAMNVYWLIPARLIIGFASGVSSVVVPVYLGEIAPPTLRGTLGTCTQFAMVIGILVSVLFAFPCATEGRWRYLFMVTPVLSLMLVCASFFLLESPRWLLNRDERSIEARLAIKKLRGYRHDRDVEQEVNNFLFASSKHKTPFGSAHSGAAMYHLLVNREMRVLVISAIVLQMSQQLCGINAVFYYSTSFFAGVIADPLRGSALVAAVNVLATYVALKLMDSTKRRTLILWSSGGMILSSIAIILALLGWLPNVVALLAVMSFVSFFEIGLGPIPWLIVAEMFDSKYVATAMSMACIVNWGCNFLVGLVFPFLQTSLGPWSFGPFCLVLIATFVFTYLYLPETHGRTVEEVNKMLSADTTGDGGVYAYDEHEEVLDAPVICAVEMMGRE